MNSNVNSLGDRVLLKGFGSKCMGFRTTVLEYNEDFFNKILSMELRFWLED